MAMGRRAKQRRQQADFWIAHTELPHTAGHPFYERLNQVLAKHGFDEFVEGQCERFYAETMGRPSLTPGRYFRLLLIGYFEGLDGERGIAWRAEDSLALRRFLELELSEQSPDHSTIARTRRRWHDKPEARQAVYSNRRRICGERDKALLRRRGELLERSFAHAYETGGMRRVYLRGRDNVLKRVLIHVGGLNLSLVIRKLLGKGTPRGFQDYSAEMMLAFLRGWRAVLARFGPGNERCNPIPVRRSDVRRNSYSARRSVSKSLLPQAARGATSRPFFSDTRTLRLWQMALPLSSSQEQELNDIAPPRIWMFFRQREPCGRRVSTVWAGATRDGRP
jgi:hypothetical protein